MKNQKNKQPIENWHDVKTWAEQHQGNLTWGQRVADSVANGMGSWKFIICQTIFVIFWMGMNAMEFFTHKWDPYPFILLNLLFSTQAAYAAPIIMMSQNRSAERDRMQAEADFQTNIDSKNDIENVQKQLSKIENEKLNLIIKILQDEK